MTAQPTEPSPYYPALLDLRHRPVVVVGGGMVARHKATQLLEAGARVTLVSPEATQQLRRLATEGRLRWRQRAFRPRDLRGAFLVVAATDDPDANRWVFRAAERRRILCNAVDDPPHCSYILPAVFRQGDLVVAVSTSGAAPALAVRIRDELATRFGSHYGAFCGLVRGYREEILTRVPTFPRRRDLWYRIVDSPALRHVAEGRLEAARSHIRHLIDEEAAR